MFICISVWQISAENQNKAGREMIKDTVSHPPPPAPRFIPFASLSSDRQTGQYLKLWSQLDLYF